MSSDQPSATKTFDMKVGCGRHQARWWTRNTTHKPLFLYGAMWDEIDEGTSMVKMAADLEDTPLEGRFIHASIDGEKLPSDFYLQLA